MALMTELWVANEEGRPRLLVQLIWSEKDKRFARRFFNEFTENDYNNIFGGGVWSSKHQRKLAEADELEFLKALLKQSVGLYTWSRIHEEEEPP